MLLECVILIIYNNGLNICYDNLSKNLFFYIGNKNYIVYGNNSWISNAIRTIVSEKTQFELTFVSL